VTKFERGKDNYPSQHGFKYTDRDGDTLKVWQAGCGYPDGGIRISSGSIHIPQADMPDFLEALAWVQKTPCEACGGEGYK